MNMLCDAVLCCAVCAVFHAGFMLPNPDDAVIWRGPRCVDMFTEAVGYPGGDVRVC